MLEPLGFLGTLMLAMAGLGAADHLEESYVSEQELMLGVGGGISLYLIGKLLKLIGARFGSDIIYEFRSLRSILKNLILESISLDMQKKKNKVSLCMDPKDVKRD